MSVGPKREEVLSPDEVQHGNRSWWTAHPMSYDWHGQLDAARFSEAWFEAVDRRFVHGARLFATDQRPFDRIIPFEGLRGKQVLEVGCGMGLHTELMTRAGAQVTAVDLSDTSVEATTTRLRRRGLTAKVERGDAERLPFPDASFDFVWSWGVIHHSARTGRVVREIARVLRPEGECRVMVYNREGMPARIAWLKDHLLKGGFLRRSFEETLYRTTDGFSARYYVREQLDDLFRAFFDDVRSEVFGQDADAVPLPARLRALALHLVPESYLRSAQHRRGGFLFLTAREPR